jgi:hypothetical protein
LFQSIAALATASAAGAAALREKSNKIERNNRLKNLRVAMVSPA